MTINFKELKRLSTFCKKHKVQNIKVSGIEMVFSPEGLMTPSEKKEILKLIAPKSEKELLKEYESDLYYSAS